MKNKLPTHLLAKTILDLKVGESVYTVRWALVVNTDLSLYIRGHYGFTRNEIGTSCMRITMQRGHIQVDERSIGDYGYTPMQIDNQMKINLELIPAELV